MHTPVLLHESIEALNIQAGKIFIDGTLGSGGHSALVAEKFKNSVTIIGLDRDKDAVKKSEERLRTLDINIHLFTESFKNLDDVLGKLSIGTVDAILFDLGISTDQLENSGRGFSFLKDEPLDMRMSGEGIRASDILNSWDEPAIELILRGFGEEKFSRKIAQEIVERREVKPFKTTFDLVNAVLKVKPKSWKEKINPATKTFQALRITVNEELTTLEIGLEKGFKILESGGRLVVISFHSLEDRIVKNFFRDKVKEQLARQITKKPIVASKQEIETNPRSRSAKLRVIEKI